MTAKLAVLVCWKPDADPAAITEFLDEVGGQLAQGPYLSVEHGVALNPATTSDKRSPKGSFLADWGFVAEMAEPGAARQWRDEELHRKMEAKLSSIAGMMTVLSWQTAP